MTEKEWRHNRLVVLVTVVLAFSGFTMVVSFLPLYLQQLGVEDVALNALYSGVIISLAPFLAGFLGPFWGKLADRRGLKPISMGVMVAFFISWVMFAGATSVWQLIAARIIVGISGGFNALAIPLATAGCPKDQLSRTIGAVQSTRTASLALGPLAGGLLSDLVGIRMTAALASSLFILAFFLILFLYREPAITPPAGGAIPPRLRDFFRRRDLLPLVAVLFVTSFVDRAFSPIIPLIVLDLGTDPGNAARVSGIVFSAAALASTLAAWFVGRAASNRNPVWLLRSLIVGSMLASLPLAFVSTSLELGIWRCLVGFMGGGILTVTFFLGEQAFGNTARATGMGVLNSALLFGFALGPLCAGLLAHLGLRVVLGLCAPAFGLLLWNTWRAVRVTATPEA